MIVAKGILNEKTVIGEFNMQIAQSNTEELTFKGVESKSVSDRNSGNGGLDENI